MLIALMLQVAAVPPNVFAQRAWGRFSRKAALSTLREDVAIAVDGRRGGTVHHRLRLTRRTRAATETLWTSGRDCPAVAVRLAVLRDLATPRPAPPGFAPKPTELLLDGVAYALDVPGTGDTAGITRLTVTSNVGTSLAHWVDGTLEALGSCWSPDPRAASGREP